MAIGIEVGGHGPDEGRDARKGSLERLGGERPGEHPGPAASSSSRASSGASRSGASAMPSARQVALGHAQRAPRRRRPRRRAVGGCRRAILVAVARVGRHPVDDDDERQASLRDPREHVPGHAVSVARGGGHEQAQVGSLEERVGQRPVVVLHGVDVRRVDDDQAGASPGPGEPQPLRGQGGERAARPQERSASAACGHHDRVARGRSQDTRERDHRSRERVDEGRLAGPGGTQEHDHERRVEVPRTRQQIAIDVVPQLPGAGSWAGRVCRAGGDVGIACPARGRAPRWTPTPVRPAPRGARSVRPAAHPRPKYRVWAHQPGPGCHRRLRVRPRRASRPGRDHRPRPRRPADDHRTLRQRGAALGSGMTPAARHARSRRRATSRQAGTRSPVASSQ